MSLFLANSPYRAVAGLASLLHAQNAWLGLVRREITAGSGLTVEVADLLLVLHCAKDESPSPQDNGYVAFRDLKDALGFSPALLSRRIAYMANQGWVEIKRANPDLATGLHGNSQKARLTEAGLRKIEPVWQRYVKWAEEILTGVSLENLAIHYDVNKLIADRIKSPRLLLTPIEPAMNKRQFVPALTRSASRTKPPRATPQKTETHSKTPAGPETSQYQPTDGFID